MFVFATKPYQTQINIMDEKKQYKLTLSQVGIPIALVVVVLALGAYLFVDGSSSGVKKEVVAKVGEETITRHDVDVRTRQAIVRSRDSGLSVPEDALFDRSLDDLITESTLYQDAVRQGFTVNKEDVNNRYLLARSLYDSEKAFLKRMKENLLEPEEFRRNLERQSVLVSYFEEMKRKELQAEINTSLGLNEDNSGVSLAITADRTPVTSDDIKRFSDLRLIELGNEFPVEVYVK